MLYCSGRGRVNRFFYTWSTVLFTGRKLWCGCAVEILKLIRYPRKTNSTHRKVAVFVRRPWSLKFLRIGPQGVPRVQVSRNVGTLTWWPRRQRDFLPFWNTKIYLHWSDWCGCSTYVIRQRCVRFLAIPTFFSGNEFGYNVFLFSLHSFNTM